MFQQLSSFNPFPFARVLRALLDFTLSNARRFYSSMGNLLDGKGLIYLSLYCNTVISAHATTLTTDDVCLTASIPLQAC